MTLPVARPSGVPKRRRTITQGVQAPFFTGTWQPQDDGGPATIITMAYRLRLIPQRPPALAPLHRISNYALARFTPDGRNGLLLVQKKHVGPAPEAAAQRYWLKTSLAQTYSLHLGTLADPIPFSEYEDIAAKGYELYALGVLAGGLAECTTQYVREGQPVQTPDTYDDNLALSFAYGEAKLAV